MSHPFIHSCNNSSQHSPATDTRLRKLVVVLGRLNGVLDAHQDRRLPLVELADLVELEQAVGEILLRPGLDGLTQVDEELVLALGGERGVEVPVLFEGALGGHLVAVGEVADAGLEEVVLDAVLHEVVADGLLGDLFVVFDGLVVITVDCGEVGDLEPELVG